MAYDRAWLRQAIKDNLHDNSVSQTLIDMWIDIGAARASQLLQCFEMEGVITRNLQIPAGGGIDGGDAAGGGIIIDGGDAYNQENQGTQDYIYIGNDTIRILQVQWRDAAGRWQSLKAMPRHEGWKYDRAGHPAIYVIDNRRVYPYPFTEGDYRVHVHNAVVIPQTEDSEVDALMSYPFVFLNAALEEAYDYKQDPELSTKYANKWQSEAAAITSNYTGERQGEALSMRGI